MKMNLILIIKNKYTMDQMDSTLEPILKRLLGAKPYKLFFIS